MRREYGVDPTGESVIMTTSHRDEPLSEAMWFLLHCTSPDERYECPSTLAILVGSSQWAAEIRQALSDPRKFTADVLLLRRRIRPYNPSLERIGEQVAVRELSVRLETEVVIQTGV